eukprot:gene9356-6703_t
MPATSTFVVHEGHRCACFAGTAATRRPLSAQRWLCVAAAWWALLCSALPIAESLRTSPRFDSLRRVVPLSSSGPQEAELPWTPSSWQRLPIDQSPVYRSQEELERALADIARREPLVSPSEVDALQTQLARVAAGDGFLLMGGDCAESFDEFSADHVRATLDVLREMAAALAAGGGRAVTTVARVAGQFAKPRSAAVETRGGVALPAYRGDIVNGAAFTAAAREPDATRLARAFDQSRRALDELRAGLAAHVTLPPALEALRPLQRAVVERCASASASAEPAAVFAGHECLLLPYEAAQLRRDDARGGRWLATSAHFLWVGERTRQPGHAHAHFVSGVANPVGVKVSAAVDGDALLALLRAVDPRGVAGRVTVIVRMGAAELRTRLPPLIRAVQRAGRSVVWCCDPMHANTQRAAGGLKTRDFDRVWDELAAFFDVHAACDSVAGGLHLELAGQFVTECVGGRLGPRVDEAQLPWAYRSRCDPRLNGFQALELALLAAHKMQQLRSAA